MFWIKFNQKCANLTYYYKILQREIKENLHKEKGISG